MVELRFVPVSEDDISVLQSIYNYYILNSTATFHKHPLTRAEMKEQLFFEDPRCGSFVIYQAENVVGHCLLKLYHYREAYRGTAELSVYLNPAYLQKGIGSSAVDFLEEKAVENEFHTLIACICAENEGSVKLFEHKGYIKCGHFKEVGRKFGRLLDVVYYQKIMKLEN